MFFDEVWIENPTERFVLTLTQSGQIHVFGTLSGLQYMPQTYAIRRGSVAKVVFLLASMIDEQRRWNRRAVV